MNLFPELERLARGLGAGKIGHAEVFARVDALFPTPAEIKAWSFETTVERAAAMGIASLDTDILLAASIALQRSFAARRHYPTGYDLHLFRLKRALADAMAKTLATTPLPAENANRFRVVQMVPWLPGNRNNNIARVAAGYLEGLTKNPEVEDAILLVTNENAVSSDTPYREAKRDAREHMASHAEILREFGVAPEKIVYAAPPLSPEGNRATLVQRLQEFRPNILFVPNVEMTSSYAHWIAKFCPTVYLQTSIRNRPPLDFTRYLYLGERRVIDRSHISPEKWFFHSFGYENFGAGSGLKRADIGLPDDGFVLVTAGNRLEWEANPEIQEVVASLMATHPNAIWMLIGVQDAAKIKANLSPKLRPYEARILFKSYVAEIGDYLGLSDVYVNPRRTGGAVSMALSVYARTPVLTFPGNDAGNFVIPELIADTPQQYQLTLQRLARERAYLAETSARQYAAFMAHHSIDAAVRDLVAHFHRARSDWRVRPAP